MNNNINEHFEYCKLWIKEINPKYYKNHKSMFKLNSEFYNEMVTLGAKLEDNYKSNQKLNSIEIREYVQQDLRDYILAIFAQDEEDITPVKSVLIDYNDEEEDLPY